jgi:hypothetical protein
MPLGGKAESYTSLRATEVSQDGWEELIIKSRVELRRTCDEDEGNTRPGGYRTQFLEIISLDGSVLDNTVLYLTFRAVLEGNGCNTRAAWWVFVGNIRSSLRKGLKLVKTTPLFAFRYENLDSYTLEKEKKTRCLKYENKGCWA